MSKSNYNQGNIGSGIHFSEAAFGIPQSSSMLATPCHLTTFNAGDIIPIYCAEVLPDDEFDFSLGESVIRQTTLLTPTMGNMDVDIYAFFVPNRIVNQSWKAVLGENYNGSWTANPVSLVSLVPPTGVSGSYIVPVGSVADYYGFPTQLDIPRSVLSKCHDLKFRGYVMIYNEFFRDQNYQPPIPMSTLNTYQGFFDHSTSGSQFSRLDIVNGTLTSNGSSNFVGQGADSGSGSVGFGSITNSLYGSDSFSSNPGGFVSGNVPTVLLSSRFDALSAPLKANKLHDYFTSVLPSPQKGGSVLAPVTGSLNLPSQFVTTTNAVLTGSHPALRMRLIDGSQVTNNRSIGVTSDSSVYAGNIESPSSPESLFPANLQTVGGSADITGLSLSVDDIRLAAAIQQVYECLARGGSRYREYIKSFFGLEVDDPFSDIPQRLGHIRRHLDLYQTAQTSASESGNTPQGNLSAFGYTSLSGNLFKHKFVEHGYIHVLAVVRHRNIYSSYFARDNFRLNMLDFYQPPLANISEQPVYTREINPFLDEGDIDVDQVFGYQEAWAEYRFEPDRVSGFMRPGIDDSLSLWNYADPYSSQISICDADFLRSNSKEVLDRTLAVTSTVAPQFKAQFNFLVNKTRPMPTYSVPGMDII